MSIDCLLRFNTTHYLIIEQFVTNLVWLWLFTGQYSHSGNFYFSCCCNVSESLELIFGNFLFFLLWFYLKLVLVRICSLWYLQEPVLVFLSCSSFVPVKWHPFLKNTQIVCKINATYKNVFTRLISVIPKPFMTSTNCLANTKTRIVFILVNHPKYRLSN